MAKRGKKKLSLSKASLLLVILAGVPLGLLYLLTSRSKPNPAAFTSLEADSTTGNVLYEVQPNVSLPALSQDLASKGLVPNATVFRWFLRLSRQDKKIKAGFYYVKPSNSVLEMTWKLTSGKQATRMVTIPEGKTSWEIYSLLKPHFPLDSVIFDSLVHSASFASACQVEAASLEGFLFPDTYVLPWKISERDILKVMVRRFHRVTGAYDLGTPLVKKYGVNGWVTLASIVEKESALTSEQELIAGVFYNRLVQGWTLGADPTVRFAVRKLTGPLFVSDLEVNSQYNTRKFPGIPPGPICNPGRSALRASLDPMKTDKMFFVAKEDGSRGHYFSVDNGEHMRYKALAVANRLKRDRGIDDAGEGEQVADSGAGKNAPQKKPVPGGKPRRGPVKAKPRVKTT